MYVCLPILISTEEPSLCVVLCVGGGAIYVEPAAVDVGLGEETTRIQYGGHDSFIKSVSIRKNKQTNKSWMCFKRSEATAVWRPQHAQWG